MGYFHQLQRISALQNLSPCFIAKIPHIQTKKKIVVQNTSISSLDKNTRVTIFIPRKKPNKPPQPKRIFFSRSSGLLLIKFIVPLSYMTIKDVRIKFLKKFFKRSRKSISFKNLFPFSYATIFSNYLKTLLKQ